MLRFLLCVAAGGHAEAGVCSRCDAPEGGTTVADLLHEFSMRQIRPLCRPCWLRLGKPSAYLYAGKTEVLCSKCKALVQPREIVWVARK